MFSDGRVIVGPVRPPELHPTAESYETPVLAPSSLAWRLYDARGRALTGLEWAMRGSQNYPPRLKSVIFAPGASNPGFDCFFRKRRCIPNWVYWLAGGLTQPLPLAALRPAAIGWPSTPGTGPATGPRSITGSSSRSRTRPARRPAESGPLSPHFDYDETGASTTPPLS